MTFPPDFPGAIVVPAAHYGYGVANRPRGLCFHTPEEKADTDPHTPYYFATTSRPASTTWFVSWTGLVFQCVPANEGAYANAVEGKPYPSWADPWINLNLQTESIEFEGYAATVGQTMVRGGPQWVSGVRLAAHRCKANGFTPDQFFRHSEVSIYRSDPGTLDIEAFKQDTRALLANIPQEVDMVILISPARAPGEIWVLYPGLGKAHLQYEELRILDEGEPRVPRIFRSGIPNAQFDAITNLPENMAQWMLGTDKRLASIEAKTGAVNLTPDQLSSLTTGVGAVVERELAAPRKWVKS